MFGRLIRDISTKQRLSLITIRSTASQRYTSSSSTTSSTKGNGTKRVFIGTTVLLASAGGALVYGCYNNEFRNKVESAMPWTKCCFQCATKWLHVSKSKLPEENTFTAVQIGDKETWDPEFVARKNKELKEALISAIEIAENKVHIAKESKLKTIAATREHAALLKKAVDDREKGDWSAVSKALSKVDSFAKDDRSDEIEARNALDNLNKITFDGKDCPYTSDNKIIVLASETAKKLNRQIDELNVLAEKARNRSRIMAQYRELVEESRKRFAEELHKISPHIDIQDDKMSTEEAKAVIAHTRARVDALYRQLIEQQLEMEQKIANAIDAQHSSQSLLAKKELEMEQARIQHSKTSSPHPDVTANREAWEKELKERLARAASAHEQHLQQVLLMQKQINDLEMAEKA